MCVCMYVQYVCDRTVSHGFDPSVSGILSWRMSYTDEDGGCYYVQAGSELYRGVKGDLVLVLLLFFGRVECRPCQFNPG
jgi:hypothetical protein